MKNDYIENPNLRELGIATTATKDLEKRGIFCLEDFSRAGLLRFGAYGYFGGKFQYRILDPLDKMGFGIEVFFGTKDALKSHRMYVLERPLSCVIKNREIRRELYKHGIVSVKHLAGMPNREIIDMFDAASASPFEPAFGQGEKAVGISGYEALSQIKNGLYNIGIFSNWDTMQVEFDDAKIAKLSATSAIDLSVADLGFKKSFREFLFDIDIFEVRDLVEATPEKIHFLRYAGAASVLAVENELGKLGLSINSNSSQR